MTISRRRFLTIAAGLFPATTLANEKIRWRGQAFGAEVSIVVRGDSVARLQHDLQVIIDRIRQIESVFSLFDPQSEISRLNQEGQLKHPSVLFVELLESVNLVFQLTEGWFDPTVQVIWQSLAAGNTPNVAKHALGFDQVEFDHERITLAHPDMAITLNGIAQGFAADKIAALMRHLGHQQCLINMGEFAAVGRHWHLGIENQKNQLIKVLNLSDRAVATSSTDSLLISNQSHIINPIDTKRPRWQLVSVVADRATLADGLSTGLVYLDEKEVQSVANYPEVNQIIVQDLTQNVTTFS